MAGNPFRRSMSFVRSQSQTAVVAALALLFILPAPGRCLPSTAGVSLNGTDPDASRTSGGSIITIELNKQYVPVKRDSKIVMYKAAYFGDVYIGLPNPQHFTVVFDTGSGHFFIPSLSCKEETCQKHSRYFRNESVSAVDIDHDGNPVPLDTPEADRDQVNIQYGTGEITGDFSEEVVCLKASHRQKHEFLEKPQQHPECVNFRVITATQMTDMPFSEFAFDGVAGLGLESLALQPEFSFFGTMSKQGALANSRFGVFISKNDEIPSEISFGGHDERRVLESIHWAPVAQPELGYWQVSIKRVYIGGVPLELCEAGDCMAIMDTGSSLIGVPQKEAQDINWRLAREVHDNEVSGLDCRNFPGPEMTFDLGSYNVTMGPEDYSRPAALQVVDGQTNEKKSLICRASLLPVDLGESLSPKSFIFGEPVLRKYYSVYDFDGVRIGFALAGRGAEPKPSGRSHRVLGAPPATVLPTNTVVV